MLGTRGTGKSTWVRTTLPDAFTINLLPPATMLRYERDPALLRREVRALDPGRWIVVDEVQRVPKLLDEVHFLMEEHGFKRFALTGSSARKLKRGHANLLAGRAVVRNLRSLTWGETDCSVSLSQLLRFGGLPLSVTSQDDEEREDFLRAYVTMYLSEEIKAESLVRNLGSFGRFLEVAALAAGQTTNLSGLARDASVSRETARGYFEVLVDTLIGNWLPAFRPRAKVKEVVHPKFYWFDTGVLNAAAGAFDQPPPASWQGVLFEHLVFHELRSHMDYHGVKGSLAYWRTPGGSEVDFVWWHGQRRVAVEAKHGTVYRSEFTKGIEAFSAGGAVESYVVYQGGAELMVDRTRVLPLEVFLRRLCRGEIIG